jgi:iron complex transport system substrate-binding protein
VHTMDSPRPERRRFTALLTLVTLLASMMLAGCGSVDTVDEASDSTASPESEFPAEVLSGPVHGGKDITIRDEPAKIVSLSPTATEMLWEIGAGDQVVAVDDQSDYPKDVPTTKLSGYEPNVEAILEYEPDLVVAADDTGDLVANLDKARVPTLLLPAAEDLEETYSQMERLGTATGHTDEAEQDVADMRKDIDQALADAPDADGLTYLHELTPDLYTAAGSTFIGEVYGLFGLENIADDSKVKDDYPKLSKEYVVDADPDLVFLADGQCCDVTVGDVEERPGWEQVAAVTDDQVHVVNEDVASRWGPRVVDFVQQVSDILAERESALGTSDG